MQSPLNPVQISNLHFHQLTPSNLRVITSQLPVKNRSNKAQNLSTILSIHWLQVRAMFFFLNPHDISPLFTVKPFISVSQSYFIFI